MQEANESRTPIRVMALHALAYCERLFYVEEVEQIRIPDHRVHAGRTLHEGIEEEGELCGITLESEKWGLKGKVGYVRYRDLCPLCAGRIQEKGEEGGWSQEGLLKTGASAQGR